MSSLGSGGRPIVVDSVRYRWSVRSEPSKLHIMVFVQAEGEPGTLAVKVHPQTWNEWLTTCPKWSTERDDGPPKVSIKPNFVAQCISSARLSGWNPKDRPTFSLESPLMAEPDLSDNA